MKYYAKPELWVDEPCKAAVMGASDTGLDVGGEEELEEE